MDQTTNPTNPDQIQPNDFSDPTNPYGQMMRDRLQNKHPNDVEIRDNDDMNSRLQPIDFTKPGNVFLLCGKQGSGKTNAVRYCLLKNTVQNKIYEVVIVFTKTKFDGEYDFVPDNMVVEGYREEVLKEFFKTLSGQINKKKKTKAPRNAIVFDDLIGLLSKHDPFLINFFGTLRHFNSDVYLPVQHLNTGSSTILRNITTHGILFNSKQFNTVKSLYENYGLLFEKLDEFKELFFQITSEPYTAMLYLGNEDDKNKNYIVTKFPDMSQFEGIKLDFDNQPEVKQ